MRKTLNSSSTFALCTLALLLALCTSQTWAKDHRQSDTISRQDAVIIAKQGRDIQVLKVTKKKTNSGSVYRVKLLTKNGRVRQVGVDAMTGAILSK